MEVNIITLCLVPLASAAAGAYFGAYLKKKGSNLATKEDLAELTAIPEKIKHEFAVVIEEMRGKFQLRLAAMDKRLAVHQEAYTLWHQLVQAVHDADALRPKITEAQGWWVENCLYMSKDARKSFSGVLGWASLHRAILEGGDSDGAIENWDRIMSVGDVIVSAVELPSLGDGEWVGNKPKDQGAAEIE